MVYGILDHIIFWGFGKKQIVAIIVKKSLRNSTKQYISYGVAQFYKIIFLSTFKYKDKEEKQWSSDDLLFMIDKYQRVVQFCHNKDNNVHMITIMSKNEKFTD